MTDEEVMVDYTKPHAFSRCVWSDSVGATCPDDDHCICGEYSDHRLHTNEVTDGE